MIQHCLDDFNIDLVTRISTQQPLVHPNNNVCGITVSPTKMVYQGFELEPRNQCLSPEENNPA